MKFLSVCSGIEAASVAWNPLGWKAQAFAEIEAFPRAVLAHHYPDVPNHGDMTKYKGWPDHAIDLLCGGTPCQSFSVAGLRKGLDDPRGNLMLTFGAIAARYRPRWLVWENVPGVLSSNGGADFAAFLRLLAQLGYGFAYRVLDAQYFGVAQRRRRVFVVACLGDWRSAAAVLFERHSLSGHLAPRREAGQVVTPTIRAGATNGSPGHGQRSGDSRDELIVPVAGTLQANGKAAGSATQQDAESGLLIAHSLRGEGFDASEDGTGRGTPLVPVLPFDTTQVTSATNRSNPKPGDPCHALPAQGHAPAIAFQTRGSNVDVGSISGTLGVNSGSASGCAPMIAFSAKDHGADAAHELAPTLRAGGHTRSHANAGVMPAIAYQLEGEGHGRMDGGTPQGSDDLSTWAMRTVRGIGCGSSSQERGLEGPLADEPAAPLPQLPHEGSSLGRALPSVRQAAQGAGVLRHALSEVQEVGRPDQTRRPRKSDLQPAGLRTAGAQQWAVQQACPAVKTGHTGAASEDQERSRAKPMAVRRLTPVECERLMGFPDGYTDVPWRGKRATDGPRYKALGNSWAVPTVQWIGRRIEAVEGIARG